MCILAKAYNTVCAGFVVYIYRTHLTGSSDELASSNFPLFTLALAIRSTGLVVRFFVVVVGAVMFILYGRES